jgi:ribonuclease HII
MLILGIDDAGRGPLIGPMILAGVLLNQQNEKILKRHNVRDSKTLLQKDRVKIAKIIKDNSLERKIEITYPREIDFALLSKTNLNTLEAIKTADIINEINQEKYLKQQIKVIVDCPSVNTMAWRKTLLQYIKHPGNLNVKCEHKADTNHLSAAAASILAKVTREEEVEKLKKQFGDIGSGYPSDPITKEFLKTHGSKLSESGIFRKTWSTWKKLFPDKKQATLEKF